VEYRTHVLNRIEWGIYIEIKHIYLELIKKKEPTRKFNSKSIPELKNFQQCSASQLVIN